MRHYQETDTPADSKPLARSNSVFVKRYIGIVSLVITIPIIAILWGFNSRQTNLLKQQMAHQARAFFQEIVQTRHWIINQDGVYIKKKPGQQIDPFLAEIADLKTSIKDQDGQTYLLSNHAAITKMISAIATEEHLFRINITSLNPLSPHNEPDQFEQSALQAFENSDNEIYKFVKTTGGVVFRYMAPLLTEESCLKCHAQQGYKLGDVRGRISISIPANQVIREINKTRIYSLISAITLLSLLLSLVLYITKRFLSDLEKSEKKLVELATTDPLTGLLDRREGLRRFQEEISHGMRDKSPLAVILLDIDFFKQINDNFGHQVGDDAIRMVADTLRNTLRAYDIICRYGGEEYLVILPTTALAKALETAERIRLLLERQVIQTKADKTVNLTASCGVSALKPDDTLYSLICRADNALYIAKEEGRNQVQHLE